MAGEAGHAIIAVRAVGFRYARPPAEAPVVGARARHQLGARRLGIEMRPRRHRLPDQADLPFELRIDDRALDQPGDLAIVAILEFEAPPPIGVARQREVRSEEHTSELQSLMRIAYYDFCL